MKKLELLALMALLVCVMAGVVYTASPYAPVVGAVQDIEVLWAIEDARQESEAPLVTALLNHGAPLAYDKNENTFYCPIGLDHGENWPELYLTAPDASGVTICFSDDYAYDSCDEAVAEGYSYELMAYSDTQYSYFSIVFTGLPIISIDAEQEIGMQDVPAAFAMSAPGSGALSGPSRVHLRGDSGLVWTDKPGYRVEFTREADGTKKVSRSVPGFIETDAILLLPMALDDTLMRDRLSWDMYALLSPHTQSFGARRSQYVELFVSGEYAGVYLMLEPMDVADELAKAGARAAMTDSVYRSAVLKMEKDRPIMEDAKCNGWGYELFHAPDMNDGFRALEGFFGVLTQEDDAAFEKAALESIDIDSFVRYVIFSEAAGLADNSGNNVFLWAHEEDGRLVYRYKPWDMDRSWGIDAGYEFDYWFLLSVADRLLALDVGGARTLALEVWNEMKSKGFTLETVEALVAQYTHELNDSGAALRNAMRWDGEHAIADGFSILSYCQVRFPMFDRLFDALAGSDEPFDFLCGDLSVDDLVVRPIRLN
ncbi:MAG: CotH kinase family protein [Clostridia bacterium]|nr:CotH kinase family protein [Clostridia bacterium]